MLIYFRSITCIAIAHEYVILCSFDQFIRKPSAKSYIWINIMYCERETLRIVLNNAIPRAQSYIWINIMYRECETFRIVVNNVIPAQSYTLRISAIVYECETSRIVMSDEFIFNEQPINVH